MNIKIIVTAFNGYGKFVPQCMKYIEGQTIQPDEVILVLGKDHGLTTKPKARIIETELTCLGALINEGMKYVDDWVLCFNIDDILFPNALEEIKEVEADIVTLKYKWGNRVLTTPMIVLDRLKDWQKYYGGPSGYLAFRKEKVSDSDFWQFPFLWKAALEGKTIKPTNNLCAEWVRRPNSHGSGKNASRAIREFDKEAKKYYKLYQEKKTMKHISIIVPVFNGYGIFIPELMRSIKNQTVKPDEVILVLGKDHGLKEEVDAKIVETESTCLGEMINAGMEHVKEWALNFSADDLLYPCAIKEIQRTHADVITLKYKYRGEEVTTPKVERKKLKEWEKYYKGPSGYLAFKKENVLNNDFWKWPFLWKAAMTGKKIKSTRKVCAEWLPRVHGHGDGRNVEDALTFLNEQAQKYLKSQTFSVFSVVKDEEKLCKEAWESVKGADELVIMIDDRTTDKTPEIAKKFTDKIYYFKWKDDFSYAKNMAIEKCTGEWCMNLDADCILVKGGMEKIRWAIKETNADMIDTTLYPIGRDWQKHVLPKIFRTAKIRYVGAAHEHPVGGKRDMTNYGIQIEYDYSPNHAKDPDRYIRILTKEVEREPENSRWKFYLAREYYYKKNYKEAIRIFNEYLKQSKFLAERADAYLHLGRCHWFMNEGEIARDHVLQAIKINPNFKEALLFMSQIVWPRHSQRWVDFAKHADNSEVLFIR